MSLEECKEEENILRAVTLAHWDTKHNRASSSLFKGPNTSVGRLLISSLEELVDIFKSNLHKPPKNPLIFAGNINIKNLKSTVKEIDAEKTATVVPTPIEGYNAHAEIVESFSRKTSLAISYKLTLYSIDKE